MNIYLIGYRCCGKTTLGRALAHHIQWDFVDMDDRLVEEQGMSIAEMVRLQGWSGFRAAEHALLIRLTQSRQLVVGTGGGVVLEPANTAAMRSSGSVIWLRSRPETIGRRMSADSRTAGMRPALTEQGVMAEIETVLAQREPLYQAAAHFTVDTDTLSIDTWCEQMAVQLFGRS